MRDTLLKRLNYQPSSLDISLYGLTEQQVKSKPLPDKWSIFENLAHLARYHEIFRERVGLITAAGTPVFQPYKADNDPGFFEWQNKTYKQLMDNFYTDRESLNGQLASLTDGQLQGTARHPTYGLLNMEGWTEMFLLHEAHHFFTIIKLAALINPNEIIGR
ncbi:MAG TPA: DinB family protein [Chitinophagaceae bacterium]|nr:DinB family protein [Chitinophagaceae bacterium]